MSYKAAEKQLSSRMINKPVIGRLPIKALSEWCTTQGILEIPTGKRAGATIKCDYVEAIWKFVCLVSFVEWNSNKRIHIWLLAEKQTSHCKIADRAHRWSYWICWKRYELHANQYWSEWHSQCRKWICTQSNEDRLVGELWSMWLSANLISSGEMGRFGYESTPLQKTMTT